MGKVTQSLGYTTLPYIIVAFQWHQTQSALQNQMSGHQSWALRPVQHSPPWAVISSAGLMILSISEHPACPQLLRQRDIPLIEFRNKATAEELCERK